MELKQVEVYNFEELSDSVKEKVLNKFREQNDYYFLEGNLNEELNLLLEKHKIKQLEAPALRYSLSYSQGDGVSFIGRFEFKGYFVRVNLGHLSNLYSHSRTTDISIEADDDHNGDITEELQEINEEEFKNIYYEICDELEKIGYSHIEAEDDDETIKEDIRANEYKFLANGDIF